MRHIILLAVVVLGSSAAVAVAPTLAALLGLRMDNVGGRALREILLEPGR